MTSERVIVLGMEMGDGGLIGRWADAGQLPVLAALREQGAWSSLATTADVLHVSAWPSLYTGVSPGRHGVYYTFQPRAGVQGHLRFAPGIYGQSSFWKLLGGGGRRCVVFDAPYTEPEQGFAGVQVFDWGVWAQYLGTSSVPKSAARELTRHCGAYPLGIEAHDLGLAGWDSTDMSERLVRSVRAKARAINWMMKRHPWDLFFAVFGETHPAAHYCWPDQSEAPTEAPELLAVYRALDDAVGDIIAEAGAGATLIIVSGDGVGPNRAGWHLLPEILERLGFFASTHKNPQVVEDAPPAAPSRSADPIKAIRDLIPKDFRKALARRLPTRLRDALAKRVDTADIDWQHTRAFCLPTDLEGYIRINVRGREPAGIVAPGEEYRATCREISEALVKLRNPRTGNPAVRDVVVTDDEWSGPRREQLPDLIVRWSDEAKISALESPDIGTVSGESPDGRTGTHKPPGFVLVKRAGEGAAAIPADAHVFDFAPTMLAHFGMEAPGTMEGRPWWRS